MIKDLTPKQLEVLLAIKREIKRNGKAPSVREICRLVNLKSSSSVHNHLVTLERLGYIKRDSSSPRDIKINFESKESLFENKKTVDIPVISEFNINEPILSYYNIQDVLPLPADFVQNKDMFIYIVRGQYMLNRGIHDGDLLIIRRNAQAFNGDVVMAACNGEVLIRTYFEEEGLIRLEAENYFMETIKDKNTEIIGVVCGLIRTIV